MMNKVNALLATAASLLAIGVGSVPAMALSVTPTSSTSNLLNNLLGSTPGLSNFTIDTVGTDTTNGFGIFSNDTVFGLGSGIVLSTGDASGIMGPNNIDSSTTGGLGERSQLNINFDADDTVSNLFFEYVFGSEEFLEFAGTRFNDFFELQLNGTNLALLPNGDTVTINNLATTSGPKDPALLTENTGNETQLDAFTTKLIYEGVLNKGASNTLSLFVSDAGDPEWDSAVLIKGGSVTTVDAKDVPTPGPLLGLIGLGAAAIRKRKGEGAVAEA